MTIKIEYDKINFGVEKHQLKYYNLEIVNIKLSEKFVNNEEEYEYNFNKKNKNLFQLPS